jgi:hypothetical protein
MLEPIFGLILCVVIYLGIATWSTLRSEFHRDEAFEKWCAGRPIILAVRCEEADDARHRLRQLIAPHDQLVNLRGGVPWQYYRFDVEVRSLTDGVVAVLLTSAVPQRGAWTERPDAGGLAERLVAMLGPGVSEVWMHGQLHPSEARSTARDQRSWLGWPAEGGGLRLTPMIGRPEWMTAALEG